MKRTVLALLTLLTMAMPCYAAPLVTVSGTSVDTPSSATNPVPVQLSQSSTAASATNPVPVQLSQGSTAASASNPVPVYLSDSAKTTYAASLDYFTPYATPTDIVGIVGSGTKTIKIHKIFFSSTQTTAGINKWYLIKRGAADSGGSPSSATIVPMDSANAAGTLTVRKYTAAPTINNTVGTVRVVSVLSPAPASVMTADTVLFDDSATGQPITLRGTAEELSLNFAGAAVPAGLSCAIGVIATEE